MIKAIWTDTIKELNQNKGKILAKSWLPILVIVTAYTVLYAPEILGDGSAWKHYVLTNIL